MLLDDFAAKYQIPQRYTDLVEVLKSRVGGMQPRLSKVKVAWRSQLGTPERRSESNMADSSRPGADRPESHPDATQPVQPPQAPPPPKRGTPTGLIVGLAVGCGVLVLVVIILMALGMFWFSQPEEPPAAPVPGVVYEPPGLEGEGEEIGELEGYDVVIAAPGSEAAVAFALARKPEWTAAQVISYTDDWRRVEVVIGPSAEEYGIWMILAWNEDLGDYELVDEGPIAQEEPVGEEVPDIYQPGEEVALEAALTEAPDWVATVVDHSADWKSVTVWVGPPHSEWSAQLKLQWNDGGDYYDMVSAEEIPYPEE